MRSPAPKRMPHASQAERPVRMEAGDACRVTSTPRKLPIKGASTHAHIQDGATQDDKKAPDMSWEYNNCKLIGQDQTARINWPGWLLVAVIQNMVASGGKFGTAYSGDRRRRFYRLASVRGAAGPGP